MSQKTECGVIGQWSKDCNLGLLWSTNIDMGQWSKDSDAGQWSNDSDTEQWSQDDDMRHYQKMTMLDSDNHFGESHTL